MDLSHAVAMADAQSVATFRRFASTEEWLKAREDLVGASETAAVVALSRYESSYALWSRKVGIGPSVQENRAMRRGNAMEQFVADEWAREHPSTPVLHPGRVLYQSERAPFMGCSPDRFIIRDGRIGELQIKTANDRDEWSKGVVPEEYVIQCHAGMAVMGTTFTELVAYVLGHDEIFSFTIERNEDFCDYLIEEVAQFWPMVVSGRAAIARGEAPTEHPDPDQSESTMLALRARYRSERQVAPITLEGDEFEQLERAWRDAQRASSEAKKVVEALKPRFAEVMAFAPEARLPGGGRVTWKTVKKKGHVVAPSAEREFRFYPAKEH